MRLVARNSKGIFFWREIKHASKDFATSLPSDARRITFFSGGREKGDRNKERGREGRAERKEGERSGLVVGTHRAMWFEKFRRHDADPREG